MDRSWERLRTSVTALVLANLVPLVGVVALGWSLHSLLVVYWIESAVVAGASLVAHFVHFFAFLFGGAIEAMYVLGGHGDDEERRVPDRIGLG